MERKVQQHQHERKREGMFYGERVFHAIQNTTGQCHRLSDYIPTVPPAISPQKDSKSAKKHRCRDEQPGCPLIPAMSYQSVDYSDGV